MADIKKVVLAYSGGLDTSIIIPWLKENYNNPEIIAVAGDVGQNDELEGLEEKAIKTGASKLYVMDLVDEMVDDVIIPSMQMGAKYEDYLLGTAFARPVIAKGLVDIAKKEGADAIAHGCTGKGNDQIRFELAIKRFAPEMKIIAPWREWDIKSRNEEIDYAEAHNVPLKINRETNYSKDKNLWHLSHEGLDLEDPASEPQYDKPGFLEMGVSPAMAPDAPTYVTLDFEKGWPVAIDGEKMKASDIIRKLNEKGCNVTVVPYDITAEEVMAFRPDGLFLSNGPGDPTDVQPVIEMVRTLRGRLPIFGICLGHQVISLAYGARTFKMKFGHRGGNHPVKNLETGKVEITSQNHSFAVDTESLKGTGLTLTHLNLLDDTAEGVECRADRIFSVQYHPESAPGPQDSTYLFDKFIKMMEESQNA